MRDYIALDDTEGIALYQKGVAWRRYRQKRQLLYYHASGAAPAARALGDSYTRETVARKTAACVALDTQYPDFAAKYAEVYPEDAQSESRFYPPRDAA